MSRPTRILIHVLLLVGIPCLVFLPGIGLQPSHPTTLARSAGAARWSYRVEEGDVLGAIAQRELGTVKRLDEILRLNPGIRPRALPVGTVLRMPPRVSPTSDREAPVSADRSGPLGLLPLFLAMLALMALVVATFGFLERRAYLRRKHGSGGGRAA